MKKTIFYIFFPVIFLLSIEFFSFIIIKFYDFFNPSSKNTYQVRDFTEFVGGERIFTMKKNLKLKNPEVTNNIPIYTDYVGSRIPYNNSQLLNNSNYNKNKKVKFLFLGDSVPFGYGLIAEESFPYLFLSKNKIYQIINGAVPSYSLAQSIARFDIEFKKIKNIKYIYLQVFDPISQYAIFQGDWLPTDNWYFTPIRTFEVCKVIKNEKYNFINKLNTFVLIAKIKRRINWCPIKPMTDESDQKYLSPIKQQIDELIKINKDIKAQLIIAPAVVSPDSIKTLNKSYKRALNLMNNYLEHRSKKNEFIFFDSRKFLDLETDFIDFVHLSFFGGEKVANYLNSLINSKMD
jgi:hypothetical protein